MVLWVDLVFGLGIKQDVVGVGTVSADSVFKDEHAGRVRPNDFVSVVGLSEYLVEDESVPRGGLIVYVPVERTGGFQDAVYLFECRYDVIEILALALCGGAE